MSPAPKMIREETPVNENLSAKSRLVIWIDQGFCKVDAGSADKTNVGNTSQKERAFIGGGVKAPGFPRVTRKWSR